MKRILVPTYSHDPESWSLALAYATKIAEAAGVHPNVTLFVHTMNQIRHTSLVSHLGEQQAKRLASKQALSLKGGTLSLQTLHTLPRRLPDGVIVAYYANAELLDAADDVEALAGIVAVPELSGECDSWAARWGALVHGKGQKTPDRLIKDPVVEKALADLVSAVNSSTGIGHPSDKAIANEILRILRAKGHEINADDIRSWAIQQGWSSRLADDLAKLAGRIAALKSKPPLSSFHDPDGRYARWQ